MGSKWIKTIKLKNQKKKKKEPVTKIMWMNIYMDTPRGSNELAPSLVINRVSDQCPWGKYRVQYNKLV